MITYREIASKDDRKFHRVARKAIGSEYGNAVHEANESFVNTYNLGSVNSRVNDARRAANLVILRWLREYGITNWKDENQQPVKRQVVKSNFASEKVKARKFKSNDGLWSSKIT